MREWKITLDDVYKAQDRIIPHIESTPLKRSLVLSEYFQKQIYLKKENEQKTNSFKVRGALNKVLEVKLKNPNIKKVVACSMGNHAQGVAFAASKLDLRSLLVMPQFSSETKIKATVGLGGEVFLYGAEFEMAKKKALDIAKNEDMLFIPPYEDPEIIAGQGTLALEILEAQPELDSVVLPLGGGGLVSGFCFVMKQLKPSVKLYAVSSRRYPSYFTYRYPDFKTQRDNSSFGLTGGIDSLADGTVIKKPTQRMYDTYISKYVDDIFLVSERQIQEALKILLLKEKTLVEGAGALPLAAIMAHPKAPWGKSTALLLSGGNIDTKTLSCILNT